MSESRTAGRRAITEVAYAPATTVSRKYWVLGTAVILAVQALIIGTGLIQGSWFADDFINAQAAHGQGLSWSFMTRDIFGHVLPLAEVPLWVAAHAMLHHTTIMVAELVVILVTSGLFARMLYELIGRRPHLVLVGTALFALSPLSVPSDMWWSSAMCVVPANCALVLTMLAFVRWSRTRDLRLVLLAAAATGIAVCFWDIANLLAIWLPCLCLAMAEPGLRSRLTALRRAWPMWVALLVPLVAFQVLYAQGDHASPVLPHATAFVKLLGVGWAKGFVPGLVGGPLHWDYVGFGFFGISAPATWVIVISELGLLTLAVITVVRDRRAWAGWAMLAMSVLPCIGLVALGRLTMQGTSIGRDYHYFSLTVAPALAGVLLAMSSAWPAAERPWGPPTRAGAPRPAGPWQAGVVLAAVVLVASGFSSASYARHWSQLTADRYLSTVASQVTHQAEASPDGRVTLLDEDVPASVFSDYLGPKTARLSRVLPTLGVTNVSYDGVADSLFRADATGHVAAARLTPVAQLTASGSRCTASGQPRTVTFRSATPLAATTAYVVRLLVQESAATNLRIKLLANHQPLLTGFYDDSLFTVPAGNHAVAITEIGASFDEVRISFDATTYACVTTAEVDAAH